MVGKGDPVATEYRSCHLATMSAPKEGAICTTLQSARERGLSAFFFPCYAPTFLKH